jgi:alpha-glucosidase
VLDAKIAEYVVVARRKGKDWYIGGMTNWTPRDLEIVLDFLPAGNFHIEAYRDGENADRMASDYKLFKGSVTTGLKMKIHLAEGGGWAAHIHP